MSLRNHKRKLEDLLNQYTDEALRKGLTPESPELPHIAKHYDKKWRNYCKNSRTYPAPNEEAFMNHIKLCQ